VQLAQLVPGLGADLLDQPGADPVIGTECFRLPPAAVQREHELAVEPLVQRVLGDQGLEGRDQFAVAAQPQVRLDPPLLGLNVQVLEPWALFAVQRLDRDVGERLPAPERQCLAKQCPRLRPGRRADRRPSFPAQPRELQQVHLVLAGLDLVAGKLGDQPGRGPGAEDPAQPHDVCPQRRRRLTRRLAVPDDLGQRVGRHGLPGAQEQGRQHGPLQWRADLDGRVPVMDEQGPQDPEPHPVSRPAPRTAPVPRQAQRKCDRNSTPSAQT